MFPTRMPLTFSRPIPHGSDRLHTATPPLCRQPQHPPRLSIRTLNICDVQVFGLAQAIRVVERGGFDVMLLTETKISTMAYFQNRLGYEVTCLTAQPSRAGGAQNGVIIVRKERSVRWGIESTHYHGPDMVSCDIVTGLTRTPVVSAYLPPSTLEHLTDLEEDLKQFRDPIFLG